MLKYNLAKMLEEVKRDEGGVRRADVATAKKVLSQEEIKAMARNRRKAAKKGNGAA